MNKKPRYINNPLAVIGVFAGLAESSLIYAIGLIEPEIQYIFIWFVIGFPTLLVMLYFLVLIFKPNVLYAPRDFENEENFLLMMGVSRRRIRNKKNLLDKKVQES